MCIQSSCTTVYNLALDRGRRSLQGMIKFRVLRKFWKTKQKMIALVTATFKALLSVAKTNFRFSGCKLHTGNIYHFFRNIFTHTFTSSKYKKRCAQKGTHRKSVPSLLSHNLFPALSGYEEKRKHLLPRIVSTKR